MIISPPFLPAQGAGQSDDAWLDGAMLAPISRLTSTQAPEGSFPLSHNLSWHNGIHLQGALADGANPIVRAIADGEVIFVSPPVKPNTNTDDPQNYNPFALTAAWTDNGCVIVKHKSDIGADNQTATEVVYFSLYMHLSELGRVAPAGQTAKRILKVGDPVWRKDEIGKAGQIYGHAGQVHLEICCDKDNLKKLIGRDPAWVDPAKLPTPTEDGRTDSVFGALYFYLPATTPTQANQPASHLRATSSPTTLGQALWVRMSYEQGACHFQTFDTAGRRLGALPQVDGEYNLYTKANFCHDALPQADKIRSSPSGWYELLRFGRNLGRSATDKDLLPANAAHWRRIPGADGQAVWADLNAEGTYKFSDADFPAIMGWNCVDDDTSPTDQRCDSANLKNLIRDPDPANASRMETAELARRLGDELVRAKLRRTICKFPSEWDKATIASRYAFVNELDAFKENPDAWPKLEAHLNAISFDGLPDAYKGADWRFHPREFIGHFRKCGWLSLNEFAQLVPRAGVLSCVSKWKTAQDRWKVIGYTNLNGVSRKYGLTTASRQTAFLAQVYIETGCLRLLEEGGSGNPNPALPMAQYYAAFFGRGLMQLTWAGTYADYGKFRAFADHTGAYGDSRITATSTHDWEAPRSGTNNTLIRDQRRWSPRFDPTIVATDTYNASDSGAFFWVQKHFTGTSNINRLADEGIGTEQIGRMSILVNGGGNGYNERLQYAAFIQRYRGDGVETVQAGTITATRQRINRGQWTTTGNAFTLNVNYTPQRPDPEE